MERKLRVANLMWSMEDGGAQQIVLNYLRDFQEDEDIEFTLFVYSSPSSSKYDKEIQSEGYNVVYLNRPSLPFKLPVFGKIINGYIAKRTWEKVIIPYNPDIIHVHISALLENTIPCIKKSNAEIVFDTLHSDPQRYKGRKLKRIRKFFSNIGIIPICVTEEQVKIARLHYGISDYEVLHNGIDLDYIKSSKVEKKVARKKLGILENDYVVLGVGRLNPIKNFDLLIRIFAKLKETKKNSVLLIAGEGKEKEALLNLAKELGISENVRLLGNVEETSYLYCCADVLAITSLSEASCLVALEGQAYGLRCVMSHGVPDESIITGQAKKMKENASIEEWAAELSVGGKVCEHRCSEDDYEVHRISKKLKEIYISRWENIRNQNGRMI